MNWEAMGAIGESVGALGVVVSLLYLATQLRHSSRTAKANALDEAVADAWARSRCSTTWRRFGESGLTTTTS